MIQEFPRAVYFNPPALVLCQDNQSIRDQLKNRYLQIDPGRDDLAHEVNTDMIIDPDACKVPDPQHLAENVFTGWPDNTIKKGEVLYRYPNVLVAGEGFGSGSSREHAPIAIQYSGIGLILADSFAPIFMRNATANGLYLSTDKSLLAYINNGKPIPLTELIKEHSPLSREILNSGGLLPYLDDLKSGKRLPQKIETAARPQNIAEKWLARYLHVPYVKPGDGGFVTPDLAYSYEYTAPLSASILEKHQQTASPVIYNPDQLILFNDHLPLDNDPRSQLLEQKTREFAKKNGITIFDVLTGGQKGTAAICHIKMADIVRPGINVGTDSHTPMISPFGGYTFGIGATDFAGIMQSGQVMVEVPQSTRIILEGKLKPYVTARDLMLQLIAADKNPHAFLGRVMEFGGPALSDLSPLELSVMANMSAEAHAVTAVFDPHEKTASYLAKSGRTNSADEAYALYPEPDPNAEYSFIKEVSLDDIQPTIALPSRPDLGVPLNEAPSVIFNKVIIGACVGGTIEDVRLTAYILHHRQIHPDVELIIHPNSLAVYRFAEQQGWLSWIEEAGGKVIKDIGCGACIGAGPGTLTASDICITSDSRNHVKRMGHPDAKVYLASSIVSAVASITGKTPGMDDILEYTRNIPWDEKIVIFSVGNS